MPDYDPEWGELRELVSGLDAPHAEMLTEDLRDLKIPAQIHPETIPAKDPDTGLVVARQHFRILVPDAFLEISAEVLDAMHLHSEGEATTAEILQDLEDPEVVAEPSSRPMRRLTRWLDPDRPAAKRLTLAALLFLLLGLILGIAALITR